MTRSDSHTRNDIRFRHPTAADDGKQLWEITKASGSLDLNSVYHYLIMCRHFGGTSLVAERQGRVVGFVTAYIPPASAETIFVWQVAVDASQRGQGVGVQLLTHVVENARKMGVKYLDATITPSNRASIGLFTAAARALNAPFAFEEEFFSATDFGETTHEAEVLFHIGPISGN